MSIVKCCQVVLIDVKSCSASSEKASEERSRDRAIERASDWAIERSSERASDRSAIERSSDREQVITQAPDGLLTRWLVRWVRFFKTSLSSILLMPKSKQISTVLPSVEVGKYKTRFFKLTPPAGPRKKLEKHICQNWRHPQGPLKTEKRAFLNWRRPQGPLKAEKRDF